MSRPYITLKGLKRLSVTIILRLGTLLAHNQTSGKQRLPPPASQRKQISKYVNIVTTSTCQARKIRMKLDLAFNNVKPKDWYFVLN